MKRRLIANEYVEPQAENAVSTRRLCAAQRHLSLQRVQSSKLFVDQGGRHVCTLVAFSHVLLREYRLRGHPRGKLHFNDLLGELMESVYGPGVMPPPLDASF